MAGRAGSDHTTSLVVYSGADQDGSFLAELSYWVWEAEVQAGVEHEWRGVSACLSATARVGYGDYETVPRRRFYFDSFGPITAKVEDDATLDPSQRYLALSGGAVASVGVRIADGVAVGSDLQVKRLRDAWRGQPTQTWSAAVWKARVGVLFSRVLGAVELSRPVWSSLEGAEVAGTSLGVGVAFTL